MHGCTMPKPVAASTIVQIATCPAEDLGMSTRSKWNRSPKEKALGLSEESGNLVIGLAGLAV